MPHDDNNISSCYHILGLQPGASAEEIRRAYRDLAKVWHPDRFTHDAHLQLKAQDQLKRINEAYAKLRSYRPTPPRPTSSQDTGGFANGSQHRPAESWRGDHAETHAPPRVSPTAKTAARIPVWLMITVVLAVFTAVETYRRAMSGPTRQGPRPAPAALSSGLPMNPANPTGRITGMAVDQHRSSTHPPRKVVSHSVAAQGTPSVSGGSSSVSRGARVPVPIYAPDPPYTEQARKARRSGTVELMVAVDERGNVSDVDVVKPLGFGLEEKAVESIRTWRFRPALRRGHPVLMRIHVSVIFQPV